MGTQSCQNRHVANMSGHHVITWALLQALGPRATLVRVHHRRPSMSSPKKAGITPPGDTILVGVQVDPAAALQLRDVGPPADDVQVSLCVLS